MAAERPPAGVARRLVLGTAQFGLAYGVTNRRGQVTAAEVARILAEADAAGIRRLDTAAGYGDSEAVLGRCLAQHPGFAVASKTPALPGDRVTAADAARIAAGLRESLARLGRPKIDLLLLHHGIDLSKPGGEHLAAALAAVKAGGLADRVGVSVYDAAELDGVLARFRPDLVQLPLNLFDQRLLRSGHVARLHDAGIAVQVRSAFLQGVLLAAPALPRHFAAFKPALARYAEMLAQTGLTPLTACLGFVLSQPEIDSLVFGVTGIDELRQIVAAVARPPAPLPDFGPLASDDLELIDPRRWRIAEGAPA